MFCFLVNLEVDSRRASISEETIYSGSTVNPIEVSPPKYLRISRPSYSGRIPIDGESVPGHLGHESSLSLFSSTLSIQRIRSRQ